MSAQNQFDVPEADVCRALGVSRKDVRALRAKYQEGLHFAKTGKGGAVFWTRETLNSALEENTHGAEKNAVESAISEARAANTETCFEAVVDSVPRNTRILYARGQHGNLIVRVRDNQNFVPGMKIQVRDYGNGYIEYAGRLPKQKGIIR